ncbi:hypothetical protein BMS3Bbin10_02016 [bacterium BMS3Bbin10]|nr:hypothetical protein BMS3Bbin10_02016 [bacterium BMS3Bbin10]
MPRAALAVFACGVGLYLFAAVPVAGAAMPVFAETAGTRTESPAGKPAGARSAESNKEADGEPRKPSPDPADGASAGEAGNADFESGGETVEKSKKSPAGQVLTEPAETSAGQYDFEASMDQDDKSDDNAGGKPGGEITGDPGQMSPGMKAAAPASGMEKEATAAGPPAGKPIIQPGLPVRKPHKPIVRRKRAGGTSAKKPASSRVKRDRRLCRALQACRNGFIKCKSRIKHPDQSEAWIIAKEECGAVYKTCVEKDFRGGEWAFTRWFYFKELQCG